jgi:hypothetical protein
MYAKEIASSIFMLALAVAFWVGADAIPVSPLEGQVGAAGFPKLLALSLGGLALIRLAQNLLTARRAGGRSSPAASTATADDASHSADAAWRQHARAAGMLGLGIGYILVLPILGYVLSIGLLIAAVALYSRRRPSLGLAVVVIVGAGLLHVMFVWLLQVPMPTGIWGELGAAFG